jgi:histidinol-phosphate aminotransferase
VSGEYQRPVAAAGGLRLHLNENTGGCSPRVLDAIRALGVEDVAFYPEYDEVVRETAAYLGVPVDWTLLTNGLDEGILAATVAAAQAGVIRGGAGKRPESIVPQPAFDMYGVCTGAVGGVVVPVAPRADLAFPRDAVLRAIGPATRLVFITSPNNPTGVRVGTDDIARVAAAVPAGALVFVDEAYHDFCGDTAVPLLEDYPAVIVGRTFAKGHGLAALRAGCVIARPETLALLRPVVPPYSLNVCAAAGLRAALRDAAHLRAYVDQVRTSRDRIYAVCRRLGLQYWESGANFVLVRVGDRASGLVERLAARGIYVRDRTGDAGCAGCVRITAGVVEHTERCLAAMEEILCAAP